MQRKENTVMVKQEWKSLWRNKILMIVLVFIIAIPAIYTTLFLGSMWDPYGKLDAVLDDIAEAFRDVAGAL